LVEDGGVWQIDTSESLSETPWKFWNVAMDEDGEDHCGFKKEKYCWSRGGKVHPA